MRTMAFSGRATAHIAEKTSDGMFGAQMWMSDS